VGTQARIAAVLACLLIGLGVAGGAQAQHERDHERERERGHEPFRGPNWELDRRYSHDHFYPSRGAHLGVLPPGALGLSFGGGRFFFHAGVWYRPEGRRYLVVAPPFGLVVPLLPPAYVTLWFGGVPYYYANDAYYVWRDQDRGYEVVEPPAEAGASTEPPAPEDVFMYPRSGQSAEQQAKDRYECHRWASDQTGFDPTRPEGGVASGDARARRGEYFRAMTACLEGRGYSVK
jgi:hypothetical protein